MFVVLARDARPRCNHSEPRTTCGRPPSPPTNHERIFASRRVPTDKGNVLPLVDRKFYCVQPQIIETLLGKTLRSFFAKGGPLDHSLCSGLHVVLALLLVEFALFLRGGILVLLILGHEIIH